MVRGQRRLGVRASRPATRAQTERQPPRTGAHLHSQVRLPRRRRRRGHGPGRGHCAAAHRHQALHGSGEARWPATLAAALLLSPSPGPHPERRGCHRPWATPCSRCSTTSTAAPTSWPSTRPRSWRTCLRAPLWSGTAWSTARMWPWVSTRHVCGSHTPRHSAWPPGKPAQRKALTLDAYPPRAPPPAGVLRHHGRSAHSPPGGEAAGGVPVLGGAAGAFAALKCLPSAALTRPLVCPLRRRPWLCWTGW